MIAYGVGHKIGFLRKHKITYTISLVIIFLLTAVTIVMNAILTHKYNLGWFQPKQTDYMNNIYGKPYTRAAPYFLGMGMS